MPPPDEDFLLPVFLFEKQNHDDDDTTDASISFTLYRRSALGVLSSSTAGLV